MVNLLRLLPGVHYEADIEAMGDSFGSQIPNIGGMRKHWNQVTVDGLNGNELSGTNRMNQRLLRFRRQLDQRRMERFRNVLAPQPEPRVGFSWDMTGQGKMVHGHRHREPDAAAARDADVATFQFLTSSGWRLATGGSRFVRIRNWGLG